MSDNVLESKKAVLIQLLKSTYKAQYDAIQPIPYIKDRLYCVDKVFVEGGTEVWVAVGAIRGEGSWVRLDSYKSIFIDARAKSKRCIIKGDPGYGKSTVTLQLAYDWSEGVKDSPMSKVDILILLRLRQLNNVDNMYRAMVLFLLARDPRLRRADIKAILESCSSVLVLLDGYDEYPNKDNDEHTDVGRIIRNNMFPTFHVITSTRYLPKHYDKRNTIRIRLTGFDDLARDQYIRKAVAGNDDKEVARIKRGLKENPVLDDLCQVPLFFVTFAHMTHEKKEYFKFDSVTKFFTYMIRCFHSHMRNKTYDENARKYAVEFESKHDELSMVAFEGLSKENQQIDWRKKYLCERLGQEFYDHYVRVGILIEEEIICARPRATTDRIETEIQARFYHKVFCEWYASYIVMGLAGPNKQDELKHALDKMDPFDLQYVYRFACGLEVTAADNIINYLKTRDGCDKFAILCILERAGKVEGILETIKELCSKEVKIHKSHHNLLQRSTIQLLEIASSNNVSSLCEYHAHIERLNESMMC